MENNDSKEVSTSEDKKFVSEAVKFVIGHTRNGYLSLCASVATLLKDKYNLEQEVELLKKENAQFKEAVKTTNNQNSNLQVSDKNSFDRFITSKICKEFEKLQSFKLKRKNVFSVYKPIQGCLCSNCKEQKIGSKALSPPLKIGDRVIIAGEMCGSVEYIGHVDDISFPDILIGLNLDEAVGDCSGSIKGKSYFKAEYLHGLFVPLLNVCCIMN